MQHNKTSACVMQT